MSKAPELVALMAESGGSKAVEQPFVSRIADHPPLASTAPPSSLVPVHKAQVLGLFLGGLQPIMCQGATWVPLALVLALAERM
jgi:hypothetical protein